MEVDSDYPSHYYAHPSTAYIEQPNAYYFTYRTPQQANLFYDPASGQYFYRKPHIHMHPHAHPHPTNQYYPNQNGPYQRNSQNFFHPNAEPTTETKPNGGAIITEVSDDEDDYLRNVSEKKKDYVDAISLKGDE
ncbi:hypothetical protein BpHYR1_047744 [Brachionus plicatilis]|uniref:Uncharacterized protein n=1 Tax=Brachionus plicatilis TaxID=10195 RepID=A0A3M7T814_BRAPC|nr:hypothetical protein BpHYR1_047744 [Brachionus plicatilis]